MTPTELVIARLGLRQPGLTTRPQLLSAGLTRREIDGRIRRGRLLVVHENVYRLPAR